MSQMSLPTAKVGINNARFGFEFKYKMKIGLITRLILFAATCRADISAVHYSIVEAGVDSTIYFINETGSMTCDGCDLQPSDDDTVKVRVENLPFL